MRLLPWQGDALKKKIAVIGDVILDEYVVGDVLRISPEAPVPVHKVTGTHYSAGGAANTARNIQKIGGQAYLFGVWSDGRQELEKILLDDGIDCSGVITVCDRPTIKKTRIVSNNHQMLRLDWEKSEPIASDVEESIIFCLKKNKFDAIVLSDYGKGTLTDSLLKEIIAFAKKENIPTVVDPKRNDFSIYEGCSLITPNRKEALAALGKEIFSQDSCALVKDLSEKYKIDRILITLGADGMVLYDKIAKEFFSQKARAREVFDVSGAGDTVVALMALCMASKLSYDRAMYYATVASGIVVSKYFTTPIEFSEFVSELVDDQQLVASHLKIIASEEHFNRLTHIKNKKIVFTNGCFDILHAGHVSYLEKARAMGDFLIVGINSDESVQALKGKGRPIVPLQERMCVLAALSCVDMVIPFSDMTPEALIHKVKPDILVKGSDYRDKEIVGRDFVEKLGGLVTTIDYVEGVSSTAIIERGRQVE